jgi:hypothetical protein
MIEIALGLLLVVLIVLGVQANILALVVLNIKRQELEQLNAQQRAFKSPLDSIQEWQWEGPEG